MDEERTRLDRRLADRMAAGDARALEEIYDAYAGAIYRQALSILSSRSDAAISCCFSCARSCCN